MTFITISKRKKIIVSIIAVILLTIGYYLAVYKSFGYRSKNDIIGDVLIFISIAITEMMWLTMDKYSNKNTFQVTLLTFAGIITIIGTIMSKQNYIESELNRNGINTNAIVTGFEIDNNGRTTRSYAQIRYEYNKEQILQRVEYFDDKYKLNQNLGLRISRIDPDIFQIINTDK